MRKNEIKADNETRYAFKSAGSYGRGVEVRVIAKGLKRIVTPVGGYRDEISEMADGVLVEAVTEDRIPGRNTIKDTRRVLTAEEQKEHYPHAVNRRVVGVRYAMLPNNMAIVRSSEIVGEWDQYAKERDEARERQENLKAARERALATKKAKIQQLQDLLGVTSEYDVRSDTATDGVKLSGRAFEALLEKLS